MKVLFAILLSLCIPCQAATLLFTNKVPAEQTGPEYLAGVQAISDAVLAGHRIHVSIQYIDQNGLLTDTFYVDTTTLRCGSAPPTDPNPGLMDYCSGIINLRPHIDNYADATSPSSLVSGSVDTWGRYWYQGVPQPNYAISWWAD